MLTLQRSACIDPLYFELPFAERFQAARDDGFDFVEFWGWVNKDIDAVKAASERAGIPIAGFNGDYEYSLIDPSHREPYFSFLRKSLAVAQKIGARSITIHSNALAEDGTVLNHYDNVSDTIKLCSMFDMLKECARLAEASGIAMNLEPLNITTDHPGNFLAHTQMAAEMTRLIGSPMLKVLYDVYHMQLNEGRICDTITQYSDQFGHVHVADAPGRHEPGTGEINYARVYACLQQSGYTGLVGYELMPRTSTAEAVRAIMRD